MDEGGTVLNRPLLLKIKESLSAVVPITIIVLLLHFTIAPMPRDAWLVFNRSYFLIIGMGLFTLGADIAMMPMGERIGAQLTKSHKLSMLIIVSFLIGILITVAEPDLQVLAQQVPAVPNWVSDYGGRFGCRCFFSFGFITYRFSNSPFLLTVNFLWHCVFV